jgi:glycosyltransferase involved in cell wall biosynthesis
VRKVVYLTKIPNHFQRELVNGTNAALAGSVELQPVCEKSPPSFRQHWGNAEWGILLGPEQPKKKFSDLLDQLAPDGIVFTQYNSPITRAGLRWCSQHQVPFLLGPHEIIRPRSFYSDWWRYSRYWKIANASLCRAVITMGNESKRLLARGYKGQIFDIPYSFDHSHLFKMSPPSLDEGLIFLYSGRLFEFRNPLKAIRAFATIHHRNPSRKIRLIMSGEGPLLQACEQEIERLGIRDAVTWMNDFQDWYSIHEIYRSAHVLLALQHYGTWGIIIQEAMAAGLGIVATSTIQAADSLIINGYNGYLVTLNDDDILAAMQRYVDGGETCLVHGQRSKEIVRSVDLPSASAEFAKVIEQRLFCKT